jgi:hypothetical protein
MRYGVFGFASRSLFGLPSRLRIGLPSGVAFGFPQRLLIGRAVRPRLRLVGVDHVALDERYPFVR